MSQLTSESITDLMPSFLAAKRAFKPAVKDSTNPHFKSKFVSLTGVLDAVEGALMDNDLLLSQQMDVIDGKNVVVSRLLHKSGQWLSSVYQLTPVKADPQAEGSALTYARRYAAMALLGIAPEDDDGNAATAAATRRHEAPQNAQVQPPTADDWASQIAAARSPEQLKEIGSRLAGSPISPTTRQSLKAVWSGRMNELAGASA